MKKMKFLTILLVIMNINDLKCQELAENRNNFKGLGKPAGDIELKIYEFDVFSYTGELAGISSEKAGTHYFGQEISRKLFLLNEYYTYSLPLSPGSPTTKKMVKKPLLYSAVKKVERQLKNDVSKKKITFDAARAEFNKVLDVAICLANIETGELENEIKNSSQVSELVKLFTCRILLRYVG